MLGALISGGAKLLGGFLGAKSQSKQRAQEYARQKEFAQNGIQWKAADAEKAGISKLYALGANTTSYSPQSVGGTDYGLSSAGQDIGRAISAGQSHSGRAAKIGYEIQQAQLEGIRVDNDIKRTELASRVRRTLQPGTPPASPGFDTRPHIPGQGDSGTKLKYTKSLSPSGHSPEASAGVAPEVDWYRGRYGYTAQIPQSLAESFEQNWLGAMGWQLRNSLGPYLGLPTSEPEPKKGHYLHFHPIHGWQYKKLPNNKYKLPIAPKLGPRR